MAEAQYDYDEEIKKAKDLIEQANFEVNYLKNDSKEIQLKQ